MKYVHSEVVHGIFVANFEDILYLFLVFLLLILSMKMSAGLALKSKKIRVFKS